MTSIAKALESAVQLAKPVVDGGCKLIESLLGEPCRIAGAMLADQVYAWQWQNRIRIAHRAARLLEECEVAERVLPAGFLVPLLDRAGNVDDPTLEEMWARLLCAGVRDPGAAHPAFITLLSQLSRNEAVLLSHSERLFVLGRAEDQAQHDRLMQYLHERVPDAIESYMTPSEISFYKLHLNSLDLGKVGSVTWATFNHKFETPEPKVKTWSEFPPYDWPPMDSRTRWWISEHVCKLTPLGEHLLRVCSEPQDGETERPTT
jgi:hypothetical protein